MSPVTVTLEMRLTGCDVQHCAAPALNPGLPRARHRQFNAVEVTPVKK